ncbi:Aminoglycoside phosphotransferase [Penicillium vulpinum]|uniref:Aminoglycoside phosphotransferase n=1 Tax=Penicillium vulpinum TaxID=29845 RepID=UPI002548E6A7|nr:Aminoglycoside phosphotransferase [Penicillium vulpinum]KAJ5964487.1 Aminoglycoside phosphotransferase [Penicillium vulpinum]
MADGSQVVGKVPNPNAGRAHFTTASEVATMDFVSWVLPSPNKIEAHLYSPSRPKKIVALRSYLKLVDYLLPIDSSISASYLWHGDLHTENIFVDPQEPTNILDIIDWQSTELLPLFDHARDPYLLDYDGPRVKGLEPPVFPNLSQLSLEDQKQARSLYLVMSLSALHKTLTYRDNPELYKAMQFRHTRCFEMLLLAQNLLVDGEALYQAAVLEFEDEWPNLSSVQASGGPGYPIQLSPNEIQSLEYDVAGTIQGMELLNEVQESLGEFWPEKGVVKHDQYGTTKLLLNHAKKRLSDKMGYSENEKALWDKLWPFDN